MLGLTAFFLQDLEASAARQRLAWHASSDCWQRARQICAVNWRTVLWGFGLQVPPGAVRDPVSGPRVAEWCQSLGLKQVTEDRPGYVLFQAIASVFQELLAFSE